jgi:hypothetical protein
MDVLEDERASAAPVIALSSYRKGQNVLTGGMNEHDIYEFTQLVVHVRIGY